ncbi:unnamed protein product [Prunus armeniaca]|uniref:Secreted protein n=1 Tax=Prunus armeniaca TaxID=36596 RepID=A0A6J5UCD4_PRUAR|nr:unnamed protein product [Prunus armeniaca]CAB4304590.1 unnamed protein product [Prunus armeniaca]
MALLVFMGLMAHPVGQVVCGIGEEKRKMCCAKVQVKIAQYANTPSWVRGSSSPPSIPPELAMLSPTTVLHGLQR